MSQTGVLVACQTVDQPQVFRGASFRIGHHVEQNENCMLLLTQSGSSNLLLNPLSYLHCFSQIAIHRQSGLESFSTPALKTCVGAEMKAARAKSKNHNFSHAQTRLLIEVLRK